MTDLELIQESEIRLLTAERDRYKDLYIKERDNYLNYIKQVTALVINLVINKPK